MPNLGGAELLIVLVVVLLLFGSTRLPKLARSMGQASKEFKQGINDGTNDDPRRNESVTMTRAELDAMVEREAEQRRRPPTA